MSSRGVQHELAETFFFRLTFQLTLIPRQILAAHLALFLIESNYDVKNVVANHVHGIFFSILNFAKIGLKTKHSTINFCICSLTTH